MEPRVPRRLLGFVVAVVVGHHIGVLFAPLGEVGPTRWADWIDLPLPLFVLGLAAATLDAARARRATWLLFALGALLYTQGHGIHLAANSVSNVDPGKTAHLWDEIVGHYLWYGGLACIVGALALELADKPLPARPWAFGLAVAFGLTAATNAIEGGTAVLALATAAVFIVFGWYHRRGAGAALLAAYAVSLVLIAGWGIYWRGFPQFSELGWV
jgi:hypothetical protein